MSDQTVRDIEKSMELTKKKIRKAEVLARLQANPDFQEIISEGFLRDFALDLVQKQVSPSYQDKINKKYVKDMLITCGGLKMYMAFVKQEGEMATEALADAENERARAIEEANA